jgi:hypothetical protein
MSPDFSLFGLSADLAPVHGTTQQFLAEIWTPGIGHQLFAWLELAGLLYQACFAGESPGDASWQSECPMSVHHRRMGLTNGRIRSNTCCSFCRWQEGVGAKNGTFMGYMVGQEPNTHQPILLRSTVSFNNTWRPKYVYIEEIQYNLVHNWSTDPIYIYVYTYMYILI